MSVPLPDSSLVAIRKKVRRLTASPSESSLSTNDLDQYIQTYYNQDFPYSIKLDQMRSVFTFYTQPYIDRYPLDVNYNQGVRAPFYVDGIQGSFYKDRQQFFNIWPRFPTKFQQGTTTLTGSITGIAQPTNPTQITSTDHNLSTGAVVLIEDVVGMTELNDNFYEITVIDANTFSLNDVDNTTFGAYVSGGTWTATNQTFSFTIPGPFLSQNVTIGGVDAFDNPISINDDGNGNLQYLQPNPVVSVPPSATVPPTSAYPGMYNLNTANPGLINPTIIGTVDYVTGQMDFTLPFGVSLASGTLLTIWVSQYQTGRPYSLLFWNNEFTIRPVPRLIHKIEIETYLTPIRFLSQTNTTILNQWWQLLAYGVAREILRERQDLEGVQNLEEGFLRQEALVLERQGVEEIFQPNITLFNSTTQAIGGVNGIGYWW